MDSPALTPILVTGAHRTGTTWVGRMLAADAFTAYVSEPLNVNHRPGVFLPEVHHWYQYICDENEAGFLTGFRQLLDFDYHLLAEIRSIRSVKDFLRMGHDFKIFSDGLLHGQRALIKDPFAIFSFPWFARRLHCRVVVAVRHPAAFASSLRRLNWPFDFADLLSQPLLMRDHLEPYRERMQAVDRDDIVGQAALLWTMIYASVQRNIEQFQEKDLAEPQVVVVRHEDLSRDPAGEYRKLYKWLGLDFTERVERRVQRSSNSDNPAELSRSRTHSVRLDSLASLDNWRKRLHPDEIDRIHDITRDVADVYYAATDWQPGSDE